MELAQLEGSECLQHGVRQLHVKSLETFLLVRGTNVGMEGGRQGFLCEEYLRSKQEEKLEMTKLPFKLSNKQQESRFLSLLVLKRNNHQ